jgi:predicted PolB exonuclease-like 3'-5' exonuclease
MKGSFRYLVYDIETITDKALLQRVLYPELEGKPEQAYERHLAELATEGRDFINPAFHQPVTIGVVALNGDFEISKIGLLGKEHNNPRALVEHFWDTYNDYEPILVDYNGKGFDLRILELWAFRLGLVIRPSHFEKFGARYKFSEERHMDLHEFLGNHGAIRWRGGLNLFSKILGKPGKMGTTGEQVQNLYDQGKFFQIQDYCLSDAMDTYFVFLRTLVMRGVLPLKREKDLVLAAKTHMEELNRKEGYLKDYLEHFNFWDPNQGSLTEKNHESQE